MRYKMSGTTSRNKRFELDFVNGPALSGGGHSYSSKKEMHSEILGRYRNKQISSKVMFN
jgi:hypothetical protein